MLLLCLVRLRRKMTYSKKLKLPKIPFKNWQAFYKLDRFNLYRTDGSSQIYLYPPSYLTDETMDIFSTHKISPRYLVIFKDNYMPVHKGGEFKNNDYRLIHRDIEKDPVTNQWQKVHCGINWEMFNDSTFTWWDMSALNEVPPTDDDAIYRVKRDSERLGGEVWFNGVHYSKLDRRMELGVLDGAVKVAETEIQQHAAHLVRTDVPHMVFYKPNEDGRRYSISIRIDESDIGSWEDAMELMKPLYDE